MALDKLVDSSKLDASLEYEASRILAKTGGSSPIAFDLENEKGFGDVIDTIAGGGVAGITQDNDGFLVVDSADMGWPTGTKQIVIAENGTTTENVSGYASAEITVNVSGGSGYTASDFLDPMKPEGAVQYDAASVTVILNNRSKVTSVSLPNATAIPGSFCSNCSSLVSVSMPSITTFFQRNNAFQNCSALTTVYLPLATQIGTSQFENCTSLVRLVLQAATEFYNNALKGCINLEAVDFGPAKTNLLRTSIFANDAKLSTVVLRRSDAIAPLAYLDAFNNTPFASGKSGGTLYVPADLISEYESATNWSTILGYANNQIRSIESTHTDPTAPIDLTMYYVDGTPIPTT